jgi:hypothetical protein
MSAINEDLSQPLETERHHWLFAIPFSGRRHALGIITPRCCRRKESASTPAHEFGRQTSPQTETVGGTPTGTDSKNF